MFKRAIPVLLIFAGVLIASQKGFATAGFAEWEIKTPGGNLISHIDPLIERYGTCLRKPDQTPGLTEENEENIFVKQLVRWRYYPDWVAGESGQGFFLFNEKTRKAEFFNTEEAMQNALSARNPGQPLSQWMTPADGWNEANATFLWLRSYLLYQMM